MRVKALDTWPPPKMNSLGSTMGSTKISKRPPQTRPLSG